MNFNYWLLVTYGIYLPLTMDIDEPWFGGLIMV